jgi:Flp pilus assembly protein TadD
VREVLRAALLLLAVFRAHADPSSACAPCHREIYERYRATPMALTSGVPAPSRGSFPHAATGFQYRVAGNRLEWSNGQIRGSRPLAWFIGSGATARSYLIADDGYLFEAPVTYYSASRKWYLSPGYDRYAYPFLTRPVLPACLNCHATGVSPVAGTHNRYADLPFAEPGIGCESCHGSGERHIASARAADIVNPVKLVPDRRDSICAQCHLSGDVRVMRPGATWNTYHPGDRLADSVAVFVQTAAGLTVTSHVEKLQRSRCKQAAGDKLWCGTCHDPHGVRTVSLRETCSGCHACKAKNTDDCAGCHMPKSPVTDAQHVVYTDHSIPRRRRAQPTAAAELAPFPGYSKDPRDLALAWAVVAARPDRMAERPRAQALLEGVVRDHPDDAELLVYLAEIYRNTEKPDLAIPLYERAMRLDPSQLTASVGLGGIQMERRQFADAIRLWEDALTKDAGLVLVRTNLAMAYWQTGDYKSAERHLAKAVELAPGLAAPAELLGKLRAAWQVRR